MSIPLFFTSMHIFMGDHSHVLWFYNKKFNIGFFVDTVKGTAFTFCMIITLLGVYHFIPGLMTLILFQGHSRVRIITAFLFVFVLVTVVLLWLLRQPKAAKRRNNNSNMGCLLSTCLQKSTGAHPWVKMPLMGHPWPCQGQGDRVWRNYHGWGTQTLVLWRRLETRVWGVIQSLSPAHSSPTGFLARPHNITVI